MSTREIQDRDAMVAELHRMAMTVGMKFVPSDQSDPPSPPPGPVLPQLVFRSPVSSRTSFQIIAFGPCGPKEYRKLIALLLTQAEILEEEETSL